MGHCADSTNALLLWRLLGSRVLKVVKGKNAAEEEAEALHYGGYAAGSWQHPAFPPQEHSTYKTAAAYTHSQTPSSKHEEYAQQIQQGVYVGRRKCAKKPTQEVEECSHPLRSLAGAGNGYGKEVWCQECHARWKVSTTVPTAKKSTTTAAAKGAAASSSSAASHMSSLYQTQHGATKHQEVRCVCQLPATRLTVKKEGPTKGMHFYRCPRQMCQMFVWEEDLKTGRPQLSMEVMAQRQVTEETLQMRQELKSKEEQLKEVTAELSQVKEMAKDAVAEAITQQQEEMQEQRKQHFHQIQYMQQQVLWMTAVAGEERMGKAFQDPTFQQEVAEQAAELTKVMEKQQSGQ